MTSTRPTVNPPRRRVDGSRPPALACCALVMAMLALGCRGGARPTPPADEAAAVCPTEAAAEERERRRASAEEAMDRILRGLEKADYALFSRDFASETRKAFPESGFASFVKDGYEKRYGGTCMSREFLGELACGELTIFLWKARFKGCRNDVLLRLDIADVDGAMKVFRLLIQ